MRINLILCICALCMLVGCTGTGVKTLSEEAQQVCASVETGQELCDSIAMWELHASLYNVINTAHLDTVPPILTLKTYKDLVNRMELASKTIRAAEIGVNDADDVSEILNVVLQELIIQGVLTDSEAGLL